MTEFSIDWPHGHQTRDGQKVRILCTDKRGEFPIVALVEGVGGEEFVVTYKSEGRNLFMQIRDDLINKPAPMPIWWVNVYHKGDSNLSGLYEDRETADLYASKSTRICVRAVTFRDGRIVDVTDEQA